MTDNASGKTASWTLFSLASATYFSSFVRVSSSEYDAVHACTTAARISFGMVVLLRELHSPDLHEIL